MQGNVAAELSGWMVDNPKFNLYHVEPLTEAKRVGHYPTANAGNAVLRGVSLEEDCEK